MKFKKERICKLFSDFQLENAGLGKASHIMNYYDAYFFQDKDTLIVGYLIDDNYPSNPFTDYDCYGQLLFKNETDFYTFTGVTKYGEYDEEIINQDALKKMWIKQSLKDWQFTEFAANNASNFSVRLGREPSGDWTEFLQACAEHLLSAFYSIGGMTINDFPSFREVQNSLARAAFKTHENTRFSIPVYKQKGSTIRYHCEEGLINPYEDQDKYHAVWVPGIEDNVQSILEAAPLYCFGKIIEIDTGEQYKYQSVLEESAGGEKSPVFPTYMEAYDWLKSIVETSPKIQEIGLSEELLQLGVTRSAHAMAERSLQVYEDYANGNCFSINIVHLKNKGSKSNPLWHVIETDNCSGYLGEYYALESLKEAFEDTVYAASQPLALLA
ncbi:hypothetical protein [Thiopseudomonas alkaliphila]|uniref:hypothetical protein n=1 Tax=Thiopseudomonas alkaliphila TaxID=1697053 RepID=UPI00257633B0|nr:hypothetical protein [Thiopseudomonas alkaliphila]MDM1717328.1 hypothetical protein [Thiopseudomonas alkaliphila]